MFADSTDRIDSLVIPPPRRSIRTSKPLVWLDNYVTPSAKVACLYPISQYVSYSRHSPSYRALLAAYFAITETQSQGSL